VEHDDMNVLVIGGRVVGVELARELVGVFLNARFTGEARHVRRLAKMTALANPLRAVQVFGQSVWLDDIRRSLITSGELQRMIEEDGLRGVTSNPAVFERAIAGYADILDAPGAASLDATSLYEKLAIRDIQDAADLLHPVYRETARRDGYVSLEVSPPLAADTAGTLAEARRLWAAVGRDNLMIKVPATPEGIPAIRQLIADGTTSTSRCSSRRKPTSAPRRPTSADSRRWSRAAAIRRRSPAWRASSSAGSIPRSMRRSTPGSRTPLNCAIARSSGLLQGKVAIANAKLAHQRYQELFSSARWRALAERGAQTQRLLWASTGTKNANYRDVLYVEELIGLDTVNTMPPPTMAAFKVHGRSRASASSRISKARTTRCARSPKPASRSKRRRMRCSPRASSCSATRSASCWTRSRNRAEAPAPNGSTGALPRRCRRSWELPAASSRTCSDSRGSARRKTSALCVLYSTFEWSKGPFYWKVKIEMDSEIRRDDLPLVGKAPHGTVNSSDGSISAGTICDTKARAGCSRTASTSASSN
jgi:transaldolase/glucose-6-phosphate isomerase